ncbi:MAG TPA: hypothetical protein VGE24_05875 [Emticicia sp.]
MKTKQKVSVGMVNAPRLHTLEEVDMIRNFKKFGAQTIADYEKQVRAMDDSDMQKHAINVGLNPVYERRQMILALLNNFRTVKGNVSRIEGETQLVPKQVISMKDDYESFMAEFRASR